jgi:hypothetical protein
MTTLALTDDSPSAPIQHKYYAGIDIGYKKHTAAAIPIEAFGGRRPDAWKHTATCQFTSDASGFEALQRYLDKCSVSPNDFLVLMEPTGGNYGLSLLFYLLGKGYKVAGYSASLAWPRATPAGGRACRHARGAYHRRVHRTNDRERGAPRLSPQDQPVPQLEKPRQPGRRGAGRKRRRRCAHS